jgi:hypothetical protein
VLLAEGLEIGLSMTADLATGSLRLLRKGCGGFLDELRDGSRFDTDAILENKDLSEIEGIVADFDDAAVGRERDGVLVGLELDLAVLGDGAAYAHEEEGFKPSDVGDATDVLVEGVGESFIGSLAGCRVDADVVLEVDPGRESGVEFLEGLEAGALRFALEIVLDGLVDGFDLALAVGLVGLVVKLDRLEF